VTEGVYAHFIGVGGAGMSGIAKVAHERGIRVTGSDLKESRYTRMLLDAGVEVHVGHDAINLGDPQVVVVSSAIPETNPELVAARERGLDIWPRAKMLAHLAGDRLTVAVAGTHGKTTTSAMIATMLGAMGEDPTFLVGGEVAAFGTNAGCGEGPHYVVEADESDGSFMFLDPSVALVTNIEADHLDHYGSVARMEETFSEFMSKVPDDGMLVVCADDAELLTEAEAGDARLLTYGETDDADVRFAVTGRSGIGSAFTVTTAEGTFEGSVAVPGKHMVSNVVAAIAVAIALGLDTERALEAVGSYAGVRRRFDYVDTVCDVAVVDDYAHHPTEIRATLEAAREVGYDRVWVVFQPHRYSRTEALAPEFGTAFELADRVVLMDVYSAGEMPIPGVSGKTVVDSVLDRDGRRQVAYLPHRADIAPFVAQRVRGGDIVMTMGAGDVTTVGPEIVRAMMPAGAEGDQRCP
jgi:UDP-N-acetylmuramate--alanine ligase